MKEYILIFEQHDQGLLAISSVHPEPVEAFAFQPVQGKKFQVSTVSRKRFERWIKSLKDGNRRFEIVSN